MAIVVADTSPIRFLVEIGHVELFPRLYKDVWIPGAVARELRHERTPETVRRWIIDSPDWVNVRPVADSSRFYLERAKIDQGEWHVPE